MTKPVLSKVLRFCQSPMNARIWVAELACGHDGKVVQRSRPQSYRVVKDRMQPRFLQCDRCTEAGRLDHATRAKTA